MSKMEMTAIEPGQEYCIWTWTGTQYGNAGETYDTQELVAVTVIRKGAKKVRVQLESGDECWIYPHRLRVKDW